MRVERVERGPRGEVLFIRCACGRTIKHPVYGYRVRCECGAEVPLRDIYVGAKAQDDVRGWA